MLARLLPLSHRIGVFALAFFFAVGMGAQTANAENSFRTVRLTDDVTIDLGNQGEAIERAINGGRLTELVQGFLSRGLIADAAAVLAYALRYRPDRADATVQTAVQLVAQYNDPGFPIWVRSLPGTKLV